MQDVISVPEGILTEVREYADEQAPEKITKEDVARMLLVYDSEIAAIKPRFVNYIQMEDDATVIDLLALIMVIIGHLGECRLGWIELSVGFPPNKSSFNFVTDRLGCVQYIQGTLH